jgi:hypothetical protein
MAGARHGRGTAFYVWIGLKTAVVHLLLLPRLKPPSSRVDQVYIRSDTDATYVCCTRSLRWAYQTGHCALFADTDISCKTKHWNSSCVPCQPRQCCRPDVVWHSEKIGRKSLKISQFISKSSWYFNIHTTSLCFTPFCFKAPCQFTTPFNFRSLIFGLTPFGWQHPDMLTPYFWWKYNFWFTPFFIYTH